jgi:hypothetical protein
MIIIIILLTPSEINAIKVTDKWILFVIFVTSDVIGILLALKPGWHKNIINREQMPNSPKSNRKTTIHRAGHHPVCEQFSGHVLQTKNYTLCAGCSGLATGAIISSILMSIFFLLPSTISKPTLVLMIFFGLGLVAFNFIQVTNHMYNAVLHFFSNAALMLGFFFTVIGVFFLTANIYYGLIVILFSFLWLETRIQLSNWHHEYICRNCEKECKDY